MSFWESSGGEYLDSFLNELQRAAEEQGNGDFTATISVQLMSQLPPSDPNYDTEQIATPVNIQKPEHPYVTREQIGIGGAATVDAAAQTCLQREVALKRPRKDQIQSSANQIVREALLLARLEHPNIPPVYTLDYDAQGLPVMVMKRIKGKPWSAHLQKVSQTERATIEWQRRQLENLVKICNALTYAHDQRILHLDIKPSNIMLGNYGEVVLLDWGIALEMNENQEHMTSRFSGTPRFAAPEMFDPKKPLTPQTDVYLLGATLHYILTGQPLHKGMQIQDIIQEARSDTQRIYNKEISSDLIHLIQKATEREVRERYGSVREFQEAVQHYLDNQHAHLLLRTAEANLQRFRESTSDPEVNLFNVQQLAFQTRFGFQQVAKIGPQIKGVKEGLVETLRYMLIFELKNGHLENAAAIMTEITDLNAPTAIVQELNAQLEAAQVKRQQSKEIATQIQYRLLEQLQKKSTE